jgi:hypothetical protein
MLGGGIVGSVQFRSVVVDDGHAAASGLVELFRVQLSGGEPELL